MGLFGKKKEAKPESKKDEKKRRSLFGKNKKALKAELDAANAPPLVTPQQARDMRQRFADALRDAASEAAHGSDATALSEALHAFNRRNVAALAKVDPNLMVKAFSIACQKAVATFLSEK